MKETKIVNAGVVVDWQRENQIVVYVLQDTDKDAIEEWSKAITDIAAQWPHPHYLCLYDFSRIPLTADVRRRASIIAGMNQHLKGRCAVLLQNTLANRARTVFGNPPSSVNLQARFFTTKDEAMAWLNEGL